MIRIANQQGYRYEESPFLDYILEDKSGYTKAKDAFNKYTGKNYIDKYNNFLIGDSGGFLMNIDFIFVNTHLMQTVANYYDIHERYCQWLEGSPKWKEFWKQEKKNRIRGILAPCKVYFKDLVEYFDENTTEERKKELTHDVWITGNHYAYLNYGRMDRVPNKVRRKYLDSTGQEHKKTDEGFPDFRDGDYWYYIIDDFCRTNELNLCVCKARRKGFSYKIANTSANEMNLFKDITIANAAWDIDYLTGEGALSHMTKLACDWYETNTDWSRGGYNKTTLDEFTLGYQEAGQAGKKKDWSTCISRGTMKNASAFIGIKGYRINNEEAGKFANLYSYLGVTASLMESGMTIVGMMTTWGTAGAKDSDWGNFEHMFRNCTYRAMKFEDVWDKNARHRTCGFFYPQIWSLEGAMDENGNTLFFKAIEYDKMDKENNGDVLSDVERVQYYAQRANCPDEAFINTVENIFASSYLNNHILKLKTEPSMKFYNDGMYVLDSKTKQVNLIGKEECRKRNIICGDYIDEVPHRKSTDVRGCVREIYAPFRINGEVPKDMYFMAIDPVGVDKKKQKDITSGHSLYSFGIYTYAHPLQPLPPETLVATFTGRRLLMEDMDKLALLGCKRFNCKALVESNVGETINNFKKWNAKNCLMKDPTDYFTRKAGIEIKDNFGTRMTADEKYIALLWWRDWLYEPMGVDENDEPLFRLNYIYALSHLLELQKFTMEGNFDRISEMLVCGLEFKKQRLKRKDDVEGNGRTRNPNQQGKSGNNNPVFSMLSSI